MTELGITSIALLVVAIAWQRRKHAQHVADLRTLWQNASERAARFEQQFDLTAAALRHSRARCRELEREAKRN